MPLNSESLPTESRQQFCLALKAVRERKGVTLAEIASATKVPAFMFAALERNDLRRWPKGLFRRSFFRGYVGMIGVPVAETCAEFIRLFPDDEAAIPAAVPGVPPEEEPASDVRLAFDAAWHGPRAPVGLRLLAAVIDAGNVLSAAALAWAAGVDWPTATAVIALTYLCLGTALFGGSPGTWALSERHAILDALTHGSTGLSAGWRSSAGAFSHMFGSADDGTAETVEQPHTRPWITDARRVGPASRFRVRIKVPQ
jgi:transcriptional regulator with XRE-family HTH domain